MRILNLNIVYLLLTILQCALSVVSSPSAAKLPSDSYFSNYYNSKSQRLGNTGSPSDLRPRRMKSMSLKMSTTDTNPYYKGMDAYQVRCQLVLLFLFGILSIQAQCCFVG